MDETHYRFFKQTGKYKNYKITLVGNPVWKNLFDHYDSGFIDEVIWINKKSFKANLRYRYQFLRKVRKDGFEVCINCIFSRTKPVDDAIAIATGAKEKLGYLGDTSNQLSYEKGYDRNLYAQLFTLTS